jgi:Asp-tRNA(Asn)/Glu-tRNA(Gln) amidotransferase A subunit family amidase
VVDELLTRSGLELSELVRSGDVSARALVEAVLRRLEMVDPVLNAFVGVDPNGALAAADRVRPDDGRPFAGSRSR